jgi:hypothetical protein
MKRGVLVRSACLWIGVGAVLVLLGVFAGWWQADARRRGLGRPAIVNTGGLPPARGSFFAPSGEDVWTWGAWKGSLLTCTFAHWRNPSALSPRLTPAQHKRTWEINQMPDGWPPAASGLTPEMLSAYPHLRSFRSYEVGFPFRCARAALMERSPSGDVGENRAVEGTELEGAAYTEDLGRVLPTRVMWAGLLGNLAVLSLVPFMVVRGWAMYRARRARVRRLCPKCGYSRDGLIQESACPECGGND